MKHQAWAMERIRDVFSRRGTWVGKYRRWLISVLIFVILVAFHFWFRLSDHLGLRESLRYIVEACLVLPGGYFFASVVTLSFRSTLVLQRYAEHQGSWFKRNREKIEVAAVTSLITAIITTLVAAAIHGWFSPPPSH